MSSSSSNQAVAQASLQQMVHVVFERVKHAFNVNALTSNNVSSVFAPNISTSGPEITIHSLAHNIEDPDRFEDANSLITDESDQFVKDAFLLFRTLCKLSEKPLDSDTVDIKSQGMRSKLISLHLIHTILKTHMTIFLNNQIVIRSNTKADESFVLAAKDYICSSLARNAASISPPVFEISAEILWLIISNLRSQFKPEIEVFLREIYFPIAEMKTSTAHQKQYFLTIIKKVCNDPRALVELYLNYDCDSNAKLNCYEAIIDLLVRVALTPVSLTQMQYQFYLENKSKSIAVYNLSLSPSSAISNAVSHYHHQEALPYPVEYSLKTAALESLVAVLQSLITWSKRGIAMSTSSAHETNDNDTAEPGSGNVADPDEEGSSSATPNLSTDQLNNGFDDPSQFESLKIKKTALLEDIRQFNFKPKKGIPLLIRDGFIKSKAPEDIAEFLLNTEGLDKATIGEYLGEGDAENIAIMHAFVDLMDFASTNFVDALRKFLQAFRLPGESQKIDRYMLKFAERYLSGNPGVFANADTAYVLAYSVIMLNTDQHSPQVKARMSPAEFIKNNRGINDSSDLPEEYLLQIFNDIENNEIKLLSEQHAALLSGDGRSSGGFSANFGVLATVGRDLQREAYIEASREMSNKTEKLFKSLVQSGDSIFYIASHIEHVKPMFEVAWMSFLAGLSGPERATDDPEIISLCLEGFKLSIRIACLFDIELARISFVSALVQAANLQNLNELKSKNVDAVKILLETALTEGNMLKSSWHEILTCISQLERLQLISSGIAAGVIPDVTNARIAPNSRRESVESTRSRGFLSNFGLKSSQSSNSNGGLTPTSSVFSTSSTVSQGSFNNLTSFSAEIGEDMRSREIVVAMDKIFTQSAALSGEGIVDFVKALTKVSWEEIQSSGQSEHPRMFSLQKMVDVSYYNMDRIRVEWSQLWAIMGEQFNQVGCHPNTSVVFFALDSLRQLSIRFFDLEELPYFKFQQDFLKPFEYVVEHNPNSAVKDMVLQCLQQMILAKSSKMRSGWRTIFGAFSFSAREQNGK